ncbi:MAG: hypothetical protein ACK5MZ_00260 [Aestuariibaculum sp.]
MQLPTTFNNLVNEAQQLQLYNNLIKQLNKDFALSNIDFNVREDIEPLSLKSALHEILYTLIQEKFADYLNLLYIVDVPEQDIKALKGDDILKLSQQVSFLVLKREWQKVWLRHKYK